MNEQKQSLTSMQVVKFPLQIGVQTELSWSTSLVCTFGPLLLLELIPLLEQTNFGRIYKGLSGVQVKPRELWGRSLRAHGVHVLAVPC